MQGLEQDWITSQFGTQVDTSINTWADKVDPSLVGDSCGLICNGADGLGFDVGGGGWPGRWVWIAMAAMVAPMRPVTAVTAVRAGSSAVPRVTAAAVAQ